MSHEARLALILEALQDMAAGDLDRRVPISAQHDELDALAHAVNVVGGELQYTTRRLSKARDEAEQANRAKSVFLRNVSHEIRTPLTVILNIAELLETAIVAVDRREELRQRMISNGRALLDLVNDLLDLSKLESDKLALELEPVSVTDIVEAVSDDFEGEALRKRVPILVDVDARHVVIADPRRLRQILVNLVGNALKFTADGRILLRVHRREQRVCIDVIDTGIGISPERAEHLFEPFAQADASVAERYGGSGLGLSLSRRMARAMSGDLTLVASEGGGATFRLVLPAAGVEVVPDHGARAPSSPSRTALAGLRLLLVDDREDVRTPIALLLESRGAQVIQAVGGVEAVERGTRDRFDLILMDVRMPDLDGLEATRRLRALGITTPIVALTADAIVERRDEYVAAGYTAEFAKPMDLDRLVAMIQSLRAPC